MGEANVHYQNEPFTTNSPHHRKHPITANSPPPPPPPPHSPVCDHHHILQQNQEVVEPTDLFSMMHINKRQPPCSAATNPMKRRSPPSSSSSGEPCSKKLFCDQEDPTHNGFSAVPIPLNINSLVNKRGSFPVLRRCVSDPYTSPAPAPAPEREQSQPPERGSGLPPLPPRFRRSVSDLSVPSPDKALSCLSSEETATPDSVRLRRMKERFKEMRQLWDDVMKDEEEDGGGREEECAVVAEDDKVLAQDDLGGGDSEESVRVDWVKQCVSLAFRCPCGKGYEILLSENNCYYKLV